MQSFRNRYLLALVLLAGFYVIQAPGQEAPADSEKTAPATKPTAVPAEEGSITGTETLVFLRHGEKPNRGLGQLSPQGLNRALALATVLPAKFGKPDFIFAPDPIQKINDSGPGSPYYYVRPLETIEPTAIALEMEVQTPFGEHQTQQLLKELTKSSYANSVIFIAWEHGAEGAAVKKLVKQYGGNLADVPEWPGNDYDSLYVVKLTRKPGQPITAAFTHEQEGLDHESRTMPAPAAK